MIIQRGRQAGILSLQRDQSQAASSEGSGTELISEFKGVTNYSQDLTKQYDKIVISFVGSGATGGTRLKVNGMTRYDISVATGIFSGNTNQTDGTHHISGNSYNHIPLASSNSYPVKRGEITIYRSGLIQGMTVNTNGIVSFVSAQLLGLSMDTKIDRIQLSDTHSGAHYIIEGVVYEKAD